MQECVHEKMEMLIFNNNLLSMFIAGGKLKSTEMQTHSTASRLAVTTPICIKHSPSARVLFCHLTHHCLLSFLAS